MIGLSTALLGVILIVALPLSNNKGRLAGYYLTQASPTPFVALLSLISSNIAGYTKKTTVAAMYLIGYCVGNIIGKCIFIVFKGVRRNLTNFIKVPKPSVRKMRHDMFQLRSPSAYATVFAWEYWLSSIATAFGRIKRKQTLELSRDT